MPHDRHYQFYIFFYFTKTCAKCLKQFWSQCYYEYSVNPNCFRLTDEARKAFRQGRLLNHQYLKMMLIISLWKDADIMKWYKNNPDDKIWWLDDPMTIGKLVFSFDKKTEFSMFKDYPQALTSEQKQIFDEENPFWADFFRDRTK